MSRAGKYYHGVLSGYALTLVSTLVNLLTIPVSLAAVGRESYGMWSAVQQVTVFVMILDLGLGSSMARFITDRREHGTPAEFASFMKSLFFIGILQCLLFLLVAYAFKSHITALMGIEAGQRAEFERLLDWVLLTVALGFPLRPLSQLTYASLKLAHLNFCNLAACLANAGLLVAGLWLGWGLNSFVAGAWGAFAVMHAGVLAIVLRLRLLPGLGAARIHLAALKPMIKLSSDVSVLAAGIQLINFAPAFLITRQLGVTAMADWSVGTRLCQLVQQLVWRIYSPSEPIFWQMHERGEVERLKMRMREVLRFGGIFSAFLGGGILAFNVPFVQVWTSGRIQWSWMADIGLLGWLLVLSQASALNMTPGIAKRVGAMKYVYLLEGAMIMAMAFLPVRWAPATCGQVALVMVFGVAFFRLPYGLLRASQDLQLGGPELRPIFANISGVALCLSACGIAVAAATHGFSPFTRMLVGGLLYPAVGLPLIYRWGLPPELKHKIRAALVRLGRLAGLHPPER